MNFPGKQQIVAVIIKDAPKNITQLIHELAQEHHVEPDQVNLVFKLNGEVAGLFLWDGPNFIKVMDINATIARVM